MKIPLKDGRLFSLEDYKKHNFTMIVKDNVYDSLKEQNLINVLRCCETPGEDMCFSGSCPLEK